MELTRNRTVTHSVWLDRNEYIITDADTTRRHLAYQVLDNLLTEDAMPDMTLPEYG